MLCQPSALTSAVLPVIQAPALGGEIKVYASHIHALRLGSLYTDAGGTGRYDRNEAVAIAATGRDIQAVAMTKLTPTASGSNIVVTIKGTDTSDGALTGAATFGPPSWAADAANYFPRNTAYDFITAASAKFKTLSAQQTGLVLPTDWALTNLAANCKIDLYLLPEEAEYVELGWIDGLDFASKDPETVWIDDRMIAGAASKGGRTNRPELSGKFKFVSCADGISRFRGQKMTLRVDILKEETCVTDRLIFTEFNFSTKLSFPEGSGVVTVDATGGFQEYLAFIPSYSA